MKPANKIRREILCWAVRDDVFDCEGPPETDEQVEEAYDSFVRTGDYWDYESEFRGGEVKTGLPCESSLHYESEAVAAKLPGGWVGWTRWFGGGKHGSPGSIDWMEDAYDLECLEEERLVVVRTFKKIGGDE